MDLEGRVGSLNGRCPVITFTVQETRVVTAESTLYSGGSCPLVIVGAHVKVRGRRQPDGTVTAFHVTIRPDQFDNDEDEDEG